MPDHNLAPGHLTACQICGSSDRELIVDLGHHAPCDSLLTASQLNQTERTYPLRLLRCRECYLVQIDYVVPPEELFFPEYPYRSGITETLSKNLQGTGSRLVEVMGLKEGSLVVDLGSNDGTLLQGFKSKGMKVLGVEPTNIAKIAIENGIPTLQDFFTLEVARAIKQEHGPASAVTAANMFAHVARLGDLIHGVEELLADGGIFLTESHYLLDLVETVQYDSVYHEHLKYYSLRSILKLFSYYDFTVIDAERIPNYGGSIRVYARKGKDHPATERLGQLLSAEDEARLDEPDTYHKFRELVIRSKLDLQGMVLDLLREGKKVAAIGCPGRASTLLNFCNIDPMLIPYVAEQSTSLKLGLYVPGKHIPVVDEQIMFDEKPDYAVLLSWHYASPIIKKLRERGLQSKIILPLPQVHIFEG